MIFITPNTTNIFAISTGTGTTYSAYTISLTSQLSDLTIDNIGINYISGNSRYNLFSLNLSGYSHSINNGMWDYQIYVDTTNIEKGILSILTSASTSNYEYIATARKPYVYNKSK